MSGEVDKVRGRGGAVERAPIEMEGTGAPVALPPGSLPAGESFKISDYEGGAAGVGEGKAEPSLPPPKVVMTPTQAMNIQSTLTGTMSQLRGMSVEDLTNYVLKLKLNILGVLVKSSGSDLKSQDREFKAALERAQKLRKEAAEQADAAQGAKTASNVTQIVGCALSGIALLISIILLPFTFGASSAGVAASAGAAAATTTATTAANVATGLSIAGIACSSVATVGSCVMTGLSVGGAFEGMTGDAQKQAQTIQSILGWVFMGLGLVGGAFSGSGAVVAWRVAKAAAAAGATTAAKSVTAVTGDIVGGGATAVSSGVVKAAGTAAAQVLANVALRQKLVLLEIVVGFAQGINSAAQAGTGYAAARGDSEARMIDAKADRAKADQLLANKWTQNLIQNLRGAYSEMSSLVEWAADNMSAAGKMQLHIAEGFRAGA